MEAVKNGAKECEGTVYVYMYCVSSCVCTYVYNMCACADKKATLEEVVDQHAAQL